MHRQPPASTGRKAPSARCICFHAPPAHLAAVFGSDSVGMKAERFVRFTGTPNFQITQTVIVVV